MRVGGSSLVFRASFCCSTVQYATKGERSLEKELGVQLTDNNLYFQNWSSLSRSQEHEAVGKSPAVDYCYSYCGSLDFSDNML